MISHGIKLIISLSILGLFPFNSSIIASEPANTDPKKSLNTVSTIVIDAGHGGKDSGCLVGGIKEKHITLSISRKVQKLMSDAFPSMKVIMTRDDDRFLPLQVRADIANHHQASVFVSIHCNSISTNKIHGTETYVMGLHTAQENLEVVKRENASLLLEGKDPDDVEGLIMMHMNQNVHLDQSLILADKIERYFAFETPLRSRGVKQAGFFVLRQTAMPSVLIETGYLTNQKDFNYLNSDKGQDKIAKSIFLALVDYKREFERTMAGITAFEASDVGSEEAKMVLDQEPRVVLVDNNESSESPTPKSQTTIIPKTKKTDADNSEIEDPSSAETKKSIPMSMWSEAKPTKATKPVNSPPKQLIEKPKESASQVKIFIQLGAFSQQKDTGKAPWNALEGLEHSVEKGLHKYRIGGIADYDTGQDILATIKNKGFPDAFLVVMKDGRRVPASVLKK